MKTFNGTGTIGFNCDNCGRELLGCTWVNGMKFCAKCYQETFGNNTNNFVDLLNKEMYELALDIYQNVKQENQALKDRWQKLKEWIMKQSKPIDDIVISDDETKYIYMSDIFDEMQELEKEIK